MERVLHNILAQENMEQTSWPGKQALQACDEEVSLI